MKQDTKELVLAGQTAAYNDYKGETTMVVCFQLLHVLINHVHVTCLATSCYSLCRRDGSRGCRVQGTADVCDGGRSRPYSTR